MMGDFKTVTLMCADGHEVHVACNMLSAMSPVMAHMLGICGEGTGDSADGSNAYLHAGQRRTTEYRDLKVFVDDDSRAWRELLGLIAVHHNGGMSYDLSGNFTWDNAEAIYHIADKYDMAQLCRLCSDALCALALSPEGDSLSPFPFNSSYVLRWLNISERYQLQELYSICMEFAVQNLYSIDALHRCPYNRGIRHAAGLCLYPLLPPGTMCTAAAASSSSTSSSSSAATCGSYPAAATSRLNVNVPHHHTSQSKTQPSSSASRMPAPGFPPASGMPHPSCQAASGSSCCPMGCSCEAAAMSKRSSLWLLRSAVSQLQEYQELWEGVNAALRTEGLAYDYVHGQVRIQNFDSWRRLAPPPKTNRPQVRRSSTTPTGGMHGSSSHGAAAQAAAAAEDPMLESLEWWL